MPKMTEKSPVSLLDEFCKKKIQPQPVYTFNKDTKSDDFLCTVTSFNETMTATAKSKKLAKQLAAQNLIKHFCTLESFKFDLGFLRGIISVNETEVSSTSNETLKRKSTSKPDIDNYIGKLQEFCIKNKLPPPTFEFIESSGLIHLREFHMKCRVNDIEKQGSGFSKQHAKKVAAMEVYNVLTEEKSESTKESEVDESLSKKLKCEQATDCDAATSIGNSLTQAIDPPEVQTSLKFDGVSINESCV